MSDTAWRVGYLAGMKAPIQNPYPDDDERALAWCAGFIEGATTGKPLRMLVPAKRKTGRRYSPEPLAAHHQGDAQASTQGGK
jgi:hypothetical protein